jgi:hypothetical protein
MRFNIDYRDGKQGSQGEKRSQETGNFTVPTEPYGVAFDGVNVWVSGFTLAVELRASDGMVLTRVDTHGSAGLAFDGASIWVAEFNDNVVGKF